MPLAPLFGRRSINPASFNGTSEAIETYQAFFAWRVAATGFVLAIFGSGLGFYGPAVYLHAVQETRGWPVALASLAIMVHHMFGALTVLNLPRLYKRFGCPAVTRFGALILAVGLVGWAVAATPWQLLLATVLTGCGWVTMGKAALNAIVSPWFPRQRPRALAVAFSGSSIGGLIIIPLLTLMIDMFGFLMATLTIGIVMTALIWWLSDKILRITPESLASEATSQGKPVLAESTAVSRLVAPPTTNILWRDWRFGFVAAAIAIGLFAQTGLLAHLFSLLVPALGTSGAGTAVGIAAVAAIVGRLGLGWLMAEHANCRTLTALMYCIQVSGLVALLISGLTSPALMILGIILFGMGLGGDILPPRIAQIEFPKEHCVRVAVLFVALGQFAYAFAPAMFGFVRTAADAHYFGNHAPGTEVLLLAILMKGLAIAIISNVGQPRAVHQLAHGQDLAVAGRGLGPSITPSNSKPY
jgi:MFS family permease